ncbi:hypothetical protein QBC34DRAFT_427291 [Podospora aff. communis PSN243]|uniref:Ecp2 effector protein domain-containing protein n=1 Tax=Podospora aff. communis PSN243 TaxID=3040156 RepID=A0AAV9GH75_9PEZI|nr:hypothetical protein QBC34DRAFT_427291 [Podospora aff. communis PSN243]
MLPLTLTTLLLPLPAPTPPVRTGYVATEILPYNVTGFAAGAVILSNRVYYHFNVSYDPDLPEVQCSALGTTLSEELSSIPETVCGDAKLGVSFKWTRHPDGSADLLVKRDFHGDADKDAAIEEAVHAVAKNETVIVGMGEFARAVYDGPEDFTLRAWRFYNESERRV